MRKTAVIVAGGVGSRMKANMPKQFLKLKGKPIIVHTVSRFLHFNPDLLIALVLHPSTFLMWEAAAEQYLSEPDRKRVLVCTGGKSRGESVYNGLLKLRHYVDTNFPCLVAVHDAVRPLFSNRLLKDAYYLAKEHGASVTCVSVKFSIRQSLGDGNSKAVDRSLFYEVQTPQTFYLDKLIDCYERKPEGTFTDDASLYEALGNPVKICKGEYHNIKVTTPDDLFLAEKLMRVYDL